MSELNLFTAARDSLLAAREDYEVAYRTFAWPKLARFNWACDYFDAFARGNPQPGLWLRHDDGSEDKLSFDELSLRSSRVANFLREHGVQPGDVVLVMLGNIVPLWETMLAAIKLGAILIPATNLLTASDLRDRVRRGAVKHVVVERADLAKLAGIEGLHGRFVVGGEGDGFVPFERAAEHSSQFDDALRDVHAPLLRYFTSGTTSLPKLVEHSQQSYPVGHLSTMYWIGLRPGDVHWNISSPGWAKHAWSCFFAPWNAGACVFALNLGKFSAQRVLATLQATPIDTLCAPPSTAPSSMT